MTREKKKKQYKKGKNGKNKQTNEIIIYLEPCHVEKLALAVVANAAVWI